VLAALAAPALLSADAKGDLFRDVGYALGYAGFDIEGSRNHLSGGTDFRIGRNLLGNKLDFGTWDLTMQGPVSLELSTGGRGLSEIDLSFTTAITGDAEATPLSYVLNYDAGSQSTQIKGSLLVDGRFSLNEFGFYDLELTYSSRQNVDNEGRFADSRQMYDSDIGPINVSGNLVTDALALLTNPIFERAGYVNPFASFSGEGSISDLLISSDSSVREELASGSNPVDDELAKLLGGTFFGSPTATAVRTTASPNQPQGVSATAGASAVPEPAVLLLMLLGVPAILRRRSRRRDAR
jgi:hypothetical protein